MTFNEDFSSMNICSVVEPREGDNNFICPKCGLNHTITLKCFKMLVQLHCLDKQKVLKARDLLRQELVESKDGIDCSLAFEKFNERLGIR